MPKILSYTDELPAEIRIIEFPTHNTAGCFHVRARKTGDKIIVEEISDRLGHISTVSDLVKETKMPIVEIKDAIAHAFKDPNRGTSR